MIPAAIERNYPKRLLRAGWWQMGLFQRPVQFLTTFDFRCYPSVKINSLSHNLFFAIFSTKETLWQFDSL